MFRAECLIWNRNGKPIKPKASYFHSCTLRKYVEDTDNICLVGELSKEWQAWEDSVASKETESREVCQRLMELQALKQVRCFLIWLC